MDLLSVDQVYGDRIEMKRTMPLHLTEEGLMPAPEKASSGAETGFGSLLMRSLQGINAQQRESSLLTERMLVDPDSVDAHDVTIAMAKASTSLTMARTILDKMLRAYKEIINTR